MTSFICARFLSGALCVLLMLPQISFAGKGKRQPSLPPPLASDEAVKIIRDCAPQVAESTMSAITRHESRWRPYTIAINKASVSLSRQPDNQEEAVGAAKLLLQRGYNFDMGFAQINSANLKNPALKARGISLENIFDTCTNVRAAEAILVDCYVRARGYYRNEQTALNAALSCYNTGNFSKGITNGYVRKVYAARIREAQ